MPPGKYHIGRSLGLSVAVTVWHRSLDLDELARRMRNIISTTLFSKKLWEEGNISLPIDSSPYNDPEFLLKYLLQATELNEAQLNMTLLDFLRRTVVDYKIGLYSNNFFY